MPSSSTREKEIQWQEIIPFRMINENIVLLFCFILQNIFLRSHFAVYIYRYSYIYIYCFYTYVILSFRFTLLPREVPAMQKHIGPRFVARVPVKHFLHVAPATQRKGNHGKARLLSEGEILFPTTPITFQRFYCAREFSSTREKRCDRGDGISARRLADKWTHLKSIREIDRPGRRPRATANLFSCHRGVVILEKMPR